jgi:hypothetical protein
MCEYAVVTHSDYAGSVGLARLVDALHPQHKHHPAVMICLQMKVGRRRNRRFQLPDQKLVGLEKALKAQRQVGRPPATIFVAPIYLFFLPDVIHHV